MSRRHNTAREPSRGPARVLEGFAQPTAAAPEPSEKTPQERAQALGWCKGQLLNVRNAGSHYNVTLLGEEYDPRHPERCLQFLNPAECQNFVSAWYARESASPWS
jgi:hypothetical protein